MKKTPSKLKLGILNLGKLHGNGKTPRQALTQIQKLAVLAEEEGYHRFWLAEHHNADAAESSPEMMLPLLGASTTRIKIGTGGVLLPYYSPLKVAENFRILEALYPGRVELGVGKGPGVIDHRTAEALVDWHLPELEKASYEEKVRDLVAYLQGGFPPGHPKSHLRAQPAGVDPTPVWLLAVGPGTMRLAAETGSGVAVGMFLGDKSYEEFVGEHYRAPFKTSPTFPEPRVAVAVSVLCDESREDANATHNHLLNRGFNKANIVGSPAECRTRIEEVARRYQTNEILLQIVSDKPAGVARCVKLVAGAFRD